MNTQYKLNGGNESSNRASVDTCSGQRTGGEAAEMKKCVVELLKEAEAALEPVL